MNQGNRSAFHSFGGNVTNARALAGSAEPTVRNQTDFESRARYRRSWVQHLLHTGSALRTFVADNDNVAVVNVASHNRINRGLFRVVALRRALVNEHIFTDSRRLNNCVIGAEVAFKNRNAARRPIGIVHRVNHIGASNRSVLNPVAERASHRQSV